MTPTTPPGSCSASRTAREGCVTISQVSAGRKNSVSIEMAGSESALRGTPRTPTGSGSATGAAPTRSCTAIPALVAPGRPPRLIAYPGGHVEGYPDTFRALFAEVYADVAAGRPPPEPAYPTFADGHDAVCGDRSGGTQADERRWVKVER